MGQALIGATLADPALTLAAAIDVPASALIGRDAGAHAGRPTGVVVTADVGAAVRAADVLIDFTRPEGTLAHLAACVASGCAMVIGTTGFNAEQKATIAAAAAAIPIVFAPNMSVGVNVLLSLVEEAARRLGPAYDIEIVEMHHRHKIDAPSGTALGLGEAAARGSGRALADCAVYAREGVTGERAPGTIGFAALRGGDVVGEHTVIFAGTGERVEISHRATSRENFAGGALRAARYVAAAPGGGASGPRHDEGRARSELTPATRARGRAELPATAPTGIIGGLKAGTDPSGRSRFARQHPLRFLSSCPSDRHQRYVRLAMPLSSAAPARPALLPAVVPAILALADGTVFRGRAIGADGSRPARSSSTPR